MSVCWAFFCSALMQLSVLFENGKIGLVRELEHCRQHRRGQTLGPQQGLVLDKCTEKVQYLL